MLVLQFACGESVAIDTEIRVKVLHIGSGRVRLGFEVPRELPIVRETLREAMKAVAGESGERS